MEPYLKKYRVRETTRPRNVKLTFDENGFYMTLRRKVAQKLPEIKKRTKVYSKVCNFVCIFYINFSSEIAKNVHRKTIDFLWKKEILIQNKNESKFQRIFEFSSHSVYFNFQFYIDGLFALTILTAILAQRFQSTFIAIVCSLFFTWTGVCAHNYLHQRDNYRMLYFNLIFMSYRDWRISHVLSHHLYPNSLLDVELTILEPYIVWIPSDTAKNLFQRYAPFVYSPILYSVFYLYEFGKK